MPDKAGQDEQRGNCPGSAEKRDIDRDWGWWREDASPLSGRTRNISGNDRESAGGQSRQGLWYGIGAL